MEPVRIKADPFLSGFLGRPAYGLSAGAWATSEDVRRALASEVGPGPAFVGAKAAVGDVALVWVLEEAGFRLVDTNVQLEKPLGGDAAGPCPGVRRAWPEDEAGVRETARTGFGFSRFHLDPRVPDAAANEFKAAWAGNFFSGQRGDAMVVAEEEGEVAGFLQLLFRRPRLVIDLVAVAPDYRRRGLARAMIEYAQGEYAGFQAMLTGTQAANAASLRMYESMGFGVVGAAYVLHLHLD